VPCLILPMFVCAIYCYNAGRCAVVRSRSIMRYRGNHDVAQKKKLFPRGDPPRSELLSAAAADRDRATIPTLLRQCNLCASAPPITMSCDITRYRMISDSVMRIVGRLFIPLSSTSALFKIPFLTKTPIACLYRKLKLDGTNCNVSYATCLCN